MERQITRQDEGAEGLQRTLSGGGQQTVSRKLSSSSVFHAGWNTWRTPLQRSHLEPHGAFRTVPWLSPQIGRNKDRFEIAAATPVADILERLEPLSTRSAMPSTTARNTRERQAAGKPEEGTLLLESAPRRGYQTTEGESIPRIYGARSLDGGYRTAGSLSRAELSRFCFCRDFPPPER